MPDNIEAVSFLGLPVLSFSGQSGISGAGTTLSIELLNCNANFSAPEVGSSATFTAGSFSFTGIIQNWTNGSGSNGFVANVKLTDPSQLLRNFTVIVDTYAGAIVAVNLFNAFAAYQGCSTSGGMPYKDVVAQINGGAVTTTTGYSYTMDLSQLLATAPDFYKVTGPTVTVLDLVEGLCSVIGAEYYIGLKPDKTIVVNIIDLNSGAGQDFSSIISQINGIGSELNYGEELRNEVTKTLLIGGPKHYLSPVVSLVQYFGTDVNGVPAIATGNSFNTLIKGLTLGNNVLNGYYSITENEILASLSGIQAWMLAVGAPNSGSLASAIVAATGMPNRIQFITNVEAFMNPRGDQLGIYAESISNDLDTIYNYVKNLADTYYGKQYLGILNQNICSTGNNGETLFSDVPTNAGGWVEGGGFLFFRTDDGRVNSYVSYNNSGICGANLTDIPDTDWIIDTNLYVKADIDEKIYFVNGKPAVIIKLPGRVTQGLCSNKDKNRSGLFLQKLGESIPGSGITSSDEASRTDYSQINHIGYNQTPAIKPSAAVVAMRSNTDCYGPWAAGGGSGGTQVIVDPDIVPWTFGSSATMSNAATTIVANSARGLAKLATGSFTVAGLPSIDFSSFPFVPSINCTFGSGGVTTTYEFQTYTPKFGTAGSIYIDRIKDMGRSRQEQLKFLKALQVEQIKVGRAIQRVAAINKAQVKENVNKGGSLSRIFVGGLYTNSNNSREKVIVGTDTLAKSRNELASGYSSKAFMSSDGLYSPVSIRGDGNLPRFAQFTPPTNRSGPQLAQPPFNTNNTTQYNVDITQSETNPLGPGHSIDIVGRGSSVPNDGMMLSEISNPNYNTDYRFIAMRGPLVLHSWGYDLDGKPIPNAADTTDNARQGNFTGSGLQDSFLNDHMGKPSTWPVAPIDLRFDRKRGVWVSPQPYKIIVAKIKERINAYGEGLGCLVSNDKPLYDNSGSLLTPSCSGSSSTQKQYEWVLLNTACTGVPVTVITGVSLSPTGLIFTTTTLTAINSIPGNDIVISTTDC